MTNSSVPIFLGTMAKWNTAAGKIKNASILLLPSNKREDNKDKVLNGIRYRYEQHPMEIYELIILICLEYILMNEIEHKEKFSLEIER